MKDGVIDTVSVGLFEALVYSQRQTESGPYC